MDMPGSVIRMEVIISACSKKESGMDKANSSTPTARQKKDNGKIINLWEQIYSKYEDIEILF